MPQDTPLLVSGRGTSTDPVYCLYGDGDEIDDELIRKIFDKAQINPSSLTLGEKKILESYPKIFKGWSQAYHNSLEEIDARISQYAFRDACNQYAVETYYTK